MLASTRRHGPDHITTDRESICPERSTGRSSSGNRSYRSPGRGVKKIPVTICNEGYSSSSLCQFCFLFWFVHVDGWMSRDFCSYWGRYRASSASPRLPSRDAHSRGAPVKLHYFVDTGPMQKKKRKKATSSRENAEWISRLALCAGLVGTKLLCRMRVSY